MKITHFIAIAAIFFGATFAWYILGFTITQRTEHLTAQTGDSVSGRWGPPLVQKHAAAQFTTSSGTAATLQPASSNVRVKLGYQPVKMGLFWHRTYTVHFEGEYSFVNNTAITQNYRIEFALPGDNALVDNIKFTLGDGEQKRPSAASPEEGVMSDTVELAPGQSVSAAVSYDCRGMNIWRYAFANTSRIRDFTLTSVTDFVDVDFPITSPASRKAVGKGLELTWHYEDAISAPGIAIEMPEELNAGPVVAKIAYYAPLSLLLFFGVIVITVIVREIALHPVNYFFMAAGFFAFPLLLAYTLDVMPVHLSFVLAAGASVALVCGYLRAAAGVLMFRVGLAGQVVYMVLFSYSFFFEGMTGLTLTILGVTTLAATMMLTARVDWAEKLGAVSPKLA